MSQRYSLLYSDDNPNLARLLFLVDGAEAKIAELGNFERVFNIFDGNSEAALMQARAFWKELKKKGHECFYWQQDTNGRWKQAA